MKYRRYCRTVISLFDIGVEFHPVFSLKILTAHVQDILIEVDGLWMGNCKKKIHSLLLDRLRHLLHINLLEKSGKGKYFNKQLSAFVSHVWLS